MGETRVWAFRSFVTDRGDSEVSTWYEEGTPKVKAKFDTTLRYLRDRPTWGMPYTRVLTEGDCNGIIEIRFQAEKVQWRPLGFQGPLRREFTILNFATEHDFKLDPPSSCKTANIRRELVATNREDRSCAWAVE